MYQYLTQKQASITHRLFRAHQSVFTVTHPGTYLTYMLHLKSNSRWCCLEVSCLITVYTVMMPCVGTQSKHIFLISCWKHFSTLHRAIVYRPKFQYPVYLVNVPKLSEIYVNKSISQIHTFPYVFTVSCM